MLETALYSGPMDFIPQLAEPPAKLHLLVVDADCAVRSACAEIAASLGYAVESTGDMVQARSLLRGQRGRHPARQSALGQQPGPGTGLRSQAALPADRGHRHDRIEFGEHSRGSHALRCVGLPDQAIRGGRALDGAGTRGFRPHRRCGHAPVARAAAPFPGAGRHDRPLGGDGKALSHPLQSGANLASGADSGRERNGQGTGGPYPSCLRPECAKAIPPGRLRVAGAHPD